MSSVGRNDPCPCASGKKFKKCCLQELEDPDPNELLFRRHRSIVEANDEMMMSFLRKHVDPRLEQKIISDFGLESLLLAGNLEYVSMLSLSLAAYVVEIDPEFFVDLDLEVEEPTQAWRLCLQLRSSRFGRFEREVLEARGEAQMTLIEVLKVDRNGCVLIRDRLNDSESMSMDRGLASTARPGHCFVSTVYRWQNMSWFGSTLPFDIDRMGARWIEDEMRPSGRRILSAARRRALMSKLVDLYLSLTDSEPPAITNTDGDDLVLQRLVWRGRIDLGEVVSRLDAICPEDETFVANRGDIGWLRSEGHPSGGDLLLGLMRLEGDRFIAEVNSLERASRILKIVDQVTELRFELVETIPMEDMGRAGLEAPSPPKIDDETLRGIEIQMLESHYERWIDDSIPALDGRTPRDLIATPEGWALVSDLIDDMDDRPGDTYDFNILRRNLKLDERNR